VGGRGRHSTKAKPNAVGSIYHFGSHAARPEKASAGELNYLLQHGHGCDNTEITGMGYVKQLYAESCKPGEIQEMEDS
jgi:hypothetical protein